MATFVGIATGNPDFSILVNTLTYLDANIPGSALVATLNDASQDLTVFAPTNAAFGKLAEDLGFNGNTGNATAVTNFLVANVPAATLNAVILYHVSAGAKDAAAVTAAGEIVTLQGGSFLTYELPTLTDNEPDLLNPSLVTTDVAADNGILHIIDRVLLPVDLADNDAPTLAGIVAASGNGFDKNGGDFDMLLAAVTAAGLVDALNDPDADLTVFAPVDAAFIGTAQVLGFQGTGEGAAFNYLLDSLALLGRGDAVSILTEVLTYHVGTSSLQASQVLASTEIETLQGGTIRVNGTTLRDNDPDLPNPQLIVTDIQASNGVAHAISGVLLPLDLLTSDGSNDVDFLITTNADDTISTGLDNDYVASRGGRDVLTMGKGDDVALGGRGDDLLGGNRGADYLGGGRGHDDLFGGNKGDTLDGGIGRDRLNGGAGADTFVFDATSGLDTITDFDLGADVIDLTAFGYDDISDLTFTGGGGDTLVTGAGGLRIALVGVSPFDPEAENFLF